MDILCSMFLWFLYATSSASIVVLVVMAIGRWFRPYISARLMHVLWLIVLLRLLVPVFPNSPVSIFHLVQIGEDLKQTISLQPSAGTRGQVPQWPQNSMNPSRSDDPDAPVDITTPSERTEAPLSLHTYPVGLQIISVVWFAGIVAIVLYLSTYLIKMRKPSSQLRLVTDRQILAVLEDCREKFAVKKPIALYTGCHVKSPYISGLIHPWIYLPEGLGKALNTSQLAHIFAHELAHLKRRDIAWNAVGSFVLAIHWMNPLVWLCIKQMKADRELACDAYALEILGEAESVPYGMTIIACLKRFASTGGEPNLLYFFESRNQKQMERRMNMIKSYKQGSYKLSAAAVICAAVLGTVTLTNAAPTVKENRSAVLPASLEANGNHQILFDSPNRSYGNLEKAVEISDFRYQVPSSLPEGYQFDRIDYKRSEHGGKASLRFEKRIEFTSYGAFTFSASSAGEGLDAAYAAIEVEEEKRETTERIKKETLTIEGREAVKVTVQANNWEKLYYLWQEDGVLYQIEENTTLTSQELETIIASVKYPDRDIYTQYVNHDLLIEQIYDTGDLQQVPESIGFAPKLPWRLPGSLQAVSAYETQKVNFSYPDNDQDRKTRFLSISYRGTDQDKQGISWVSFEQIKNNNIYETIKKNGHIAYYRIDGEKHLVEAKPLDLGGREVLKTAKYKIDGPLSSQDAEDFVSYFWKENDVCFQVTFREDGPEQEDIVTYLMNQPFANAGQLP
ncbi:M56 family metallopeptidase [Brevibacillus humidisoli]|uniref:M56 family metallopeptidase n=1 Tax=Brevibacillus humidisoli TaxID=2895522 RepID=UPI001E4D9CB6|nr:M56 family metallopeptidase [Brevibacillus humidisoli]UFJ39004.1 M56 family metallopeptidase [Brevibacillus humidisoli]